MRYLGGKTRLAKELAAIINKDRGSKMFWDPFCGGLSMSVELAKTGPGLVSDIHPALIALYQAIRDGWLPPESVSEAEYYSAKELPDSDPMRAFAGFGCSFGGKWFGGYARGDDRNYAQESRKALLRDIFKLRDCNIVQCSFLAVKPKKTDLVIYCDPPYANVTKYNSLGVYNYELFWKLVQEWESFGVPVYVSEYQCPVPHEIVWEKEHTSCVVKKAIVNTKERLFRVLV